jgi:GMP synthase (glutamine-hydrolysing)
VRVLLINGYCRMGRDRLASHGCTDAAVLYDAMLRRLASAHGVELSTDAIYPVSDKFRLPSVDELSNFDAIAWTGSNLTIYSDAPEVHIQLELARLAYAAGVPQFGSCWGMQIAAQSAGISTLRNPAGREQGLARKVVVTPAGARHPLFRDGPTCFDGFTAHTDMVCLEAALAANNGPVECEVLAGNTWTPVQALAVRYRGGEFWGVQYHPEFDLKESALLMNVASRLLIDQGTFTDQADIDAHVELMLELADDPSRADLRLRLGIDDDVLDTDKRCAAPARWLSEMVYPRVSQRLQNEHGADESSVPGAAASGRATNTVQVSQYRSNQGTGQMQTICRQFSTQANRQDTRPAIPDIDAVSVPQLCLLLL